MGNGQEQKQVDWLKPYYSWAKVIAKKVVSSCHLFIVTECFPDFIFNKRGKEKSKLSA